MSRLILPRRDLILPNRAKQRGFIINPYAHAVSGGGATDPHFANVVLLLNMEGADGSTTFTDRSPIGRTMTAAGNAQVDTSRGYNTALFDGSGDRITTPYVQADFDWWTGDYTIDAWIYATAFGDWSYTDGDAKPTMIGCANPTSTTNYWSFGPDNGNRLVMYYFNGAGATKATAAGTIALPGLHHVAIIKNASGIRLGVNGTVTTATAVSGTPQSSATSPVVLTIGQINNRSINGHIRALRITRAARWTSNFTPPSAPFPTS